MTEEAPVKAFGVREVPDHPVSAGTSPGSRTSGQGASTKVRPSAGMSEARPLA